MNANNVTYNHAYEVADAYRKSYGAGALRAAINDWMEGSLTDCNRWTVKVVLWQLANLLNANR